MDLGIEQCFLVVLFPVSQVNLIRFGTLVVARVPQINDRVAMSTNCKLLSHQTGPRLAYAA